MLLSPAADLPGSGATSAEGGADVVLLRVPPLEQDAADLRLRREEGEPLGGLVLTHRGATAAAADTGIVVELVDVVVGAAVRGAGIVSDALANLHSFLFQEKC